MNALQRNHSTPVQGSLVDGYDRSAEPGSFYFRDVAPGAQRFLSCRCPCGCGGLFSLPIGEGVKPAQSPSWHWDGQRERPTLSPSIKDLGGCRWHGYLQAGVWKPCEDSGR